MPRTKLDKAPDKLYILLNGAAAEKTRYEIGEIIGRCPATVKSKMRNPKSFTLEEILKLGRSLHIPIEELRQAITY